MLLTERKELALALDFFPSMYGQSQEDFQDSLKTDAFRYQEKAKELTACVKCPLDKKGVCSFSEEEMALYYEHLNHFFLHKSESAQLEMIAAYAEKREMSPLEVTQSLVNLTQEYHEKFSSLCGAVQ